MAVNEAGLRTPEADVTMEARAARVRQILEHDFRAQSSGYGPDLRFHGGLGPYTSSAAASYVRASSSTGSCGCAPPNRLSTASIPHGRSETTRDSRDAYAKIQRYLGEPIQVRPAAEAARERERALAKAAEMARESPSERRLRAAW